MRVRVLACIIYGLLKLRESVTCITIYQRNTTGARKNQSGIQEEKRFISIVSHSHKITSHGLLQQLNLYHSLGKFNGRQIDDIFLIFFPQNRTTFHALETICNLSKPVFWENKKTISICRLLKILRRVLRIKCPLRADLESTIISHCLNDDYIIIVFLLPPPPPPPPHTHILHP